MGHQGGYRPLELQRSRLQAWQACAGRTDWGMHAMLWPHRSRSARGRSSARPSRTAPRLRRKSPRFSSARTTGFSGRALAVTHVCAATRARLLDWPHQAHLRRAGPCSARRAHAHRTRRACLPPSPTARRSLYRWTRRRRRPPPSSRRRESGRPRSVGRSADWPARCSGHMAQALGVNGCRGPS